MRRAAGNEVRLVRAVHAHDAATAVHPLVGVYAGGSLALDGYQPGRSDLDIAVVCRTALPNGPGVSSPASRVSNRIVPPVSR